MRTLAPPCGRTHSRSFPSSPENPGMWSTEMLGRRNPLRARIAPSHAAPRPTPSPPARTTAAGAGAPSPPGTARTAASSRAGRRPRAPRVRPGTGTSDPQGFSRTTRGFQRGRPRSGAERRPRPGASKGPPPFWGGKRALRLPVFPRGLAKWVARGLCAKTDCPMFQTWLPFTWGLMPR